LKRLIFFVIFTLCHIIPLSAQQTIILGDDQEKYPLSSHIDILEDPDGKLSIQMVTSPEFASRFRPNKKGIPNLGYTNSAFWLRLKIKNEASSRSPWVLELLQSNMGYVDFYLLSSDGEIIFEKKTGSMRPIETRDHKYHNFVFLQRFPNQNTHTVYMRFKSEQSITIPLTLWSMTAFMNRTQSSYLIIGAYIGILLIMIGYNIFLLLSLKDSSYFYYTVSIFTILFFSLSVQGLALIYLWPKLLVWNRLSLLIFAGLMVIALVKFSDNFLLVKSHTPKLHQVANIYMILIGSLISITLFTSFRFIVFPFVLCGIIGPILILVLSIVALRKGFRAARYFLISMGGLAISGIIFLLVRLGMLPSNPVLENSYHFGTIFFVLLMSLALADRIKVFRSEKEKALRDLKTSEERFRVLVETTNDFIWEVDRNGIYTYVSPKVNDLLGYEMGEMIGKKPSDFMPADEARRVAELFGIKAAKLEPVVGIEHILIKKNGEQIILDTNGVPFFDEKKNFLGYQGIDRDITQRKQIEDEARKLQARVQHAQKLESLGILAGGIAHDFNNLLMGVLGNASLALKNLKNKTEAGKFIVKIEKTAQQAAELTNQLLAYSGKGKFQVQPVNLSEIVEEITQLLKVSISKKVTLRYDFGESLPLVEADVSQLNQVIMNLIVNASEAIGDKSGVISIRTGIMNLDDTYLADTFFDEDLPEGEYITLEVSDNGGGMNEETKQKIFDPFFTTKFKGHGLGLAAVLGIVRGHKGAIRVYSEPGHGTTIKVLLPAQKTARQDPTAAAVTKSAGLTGMTILIVDDEETVRDVVSQMLKQNNLKVMTAANGKEGVQLFKKHSDEISMVILDATMPEMNGEETFRELQMIKSNVRVVLTSGYNEQDVTSYFVGKGLAGFIQKPFSHEKLITVLGDVAEKTK